MIILPSKIRVIFKTILFYQRPSSRIVSTEPVGSLEIILRMPDPMIIDMKQIISVLDTYDSIDAGVGASGLGRSPQNADNLLISYFPPYL